MSEEAMSTQQPVPALREYRVVTVSPGGAQGRSGGYTLTEALALVPFHLAAAGVASVRVERADGSTLVSVGRP